MSGFDPYAVADSLIKAVNEKSTVLTKDIAQQHGLSNRSQVVAAGKWCIENGYMTDSSQTDAGHNIWIGFLTAPGYEVATGGKTTRPPEPQATTTTIINISGGSFSNSQVGSHNTQTIELSISPEKIIQFAEVLRADGHETEARKVLEATENGSKPDGIFGAIKEIGAVLGNYGTAVAAFFGIFGG